MANYNPLFAGYITKEGGLPVDECIALTAAAMVIQGPLALAPALVAVQRHRDMDRLDGSGSDGSGEVTGPVGPPLVDVPDLIGQPLDDVRRRLKELGLVPDVSLHESADDEKGMVLDQPPPPSVGDMVDTGTMIALKVGAGQPKRNETPGDDAAAIADLRRDVDERLGKIEQSIAKLTEMVAKAAASVAPPTAQAGDKKQAGG
ncbi:MULTISPECIES: PASTA domain-containing protein [unclassified Paracoccus (in: a-proteobacteria)]|uniref:PASTA domain-containing protein n=1 Tax=unclassified Paracoccus (in: a-proteobacteria) TaxID=2688777 RepID=UPI0015FECEFA|nr:MULTISPECIES: PASTA domain-containing protein [unclassified Paracoccus (in: a-proteobacteria)]MBB1492718.1 PASTA domain-containing protein [Paracoccus sp. MC1854]MBB1499337.1 PASTA domain-containing protein [Paracoccus sp. MC1862]QQO45106.1 PASTA domain-containing protein [Paracoccus sp. MC1862]